MGCNWECKFLLCFTYNPDSDLATQFRLVAGRPQSVYNVPVVDTMMCVTADENTRLLGIENTCTILAVYDHLS